MSTTHQRLSKDTQENTLIIQALWNQFTSKVNTLSAKYNVSTQLTPVTWLRNNGNNGGGTRYEAQNHPLLNSGSINFSQVHYLNQPEKNLAVATALSAIIHPKHPLAPSMHIHFSWTEMKSGKGYWRLMADLNPAIQNTTHTQLFSDALKKASGSQFESASKQGDKYFYIPALQRHRGVKHFYLEKYNTGNKEADRSLAQNVCEAAVDCYIALLDDVFSKQLEVKEEDLKKQLAYHSLYFLQVLTLDRGTTAGLLVHDQNDDGIMGSLPSHVDKELLRSWTPKLTSPLDILLKELIEVLPEESPAPVNTPIKRKLTGIIREFYRSQPDALGKQASGFVTPDTVGNHSHKP